MKFITTILLIRCGIGTLSRNRSRAGSVDDNQMRMACRSVTPSGTSSAAVPFQQLLALTLPRNFETNNNNTKLQSSELINVAEKRQPDIQPREYLQSSFSGMFSEMVHL